MSDEEELFASLEDVFAGVDENEIDNFSDEETWTIPKLLKELSRLKNLMTEGRYVLHPRTQESRDVHSRRNAIQVELHRRGFYD